MRVSPVCNKLRHKSPTFVFRWLVNDVLPCDPTEASIYASCYCYLVLLYYQFVDRITNFIFELLNLIWTIFLAINSVIIYVIIIIPIISLTKIRMYEQNLLTLPNINFSWKYIYRLSSCFMQCWQMGRQSSWAKCSAGLWIIIKSKAFPAHKQPWRRLRGAIAKFHCSCISEMDGAERSVPFWDRFTFTERSPNAQCMGDRGGPIATWMWRRKQKSVPLTGIEPRSYNS
jgi:hypothetical protein